MKDWCSKIINSGSTNRAFRKPFYKVEVGGIPFRCAIVEGCNNGTPEKFSETAGVDETRAVVQLANPSYFFSSLVVERQTLTIIHTQAVKQRTEFILADK